MEMQQINIFWFKRDLRLNDNAGLYNALRSNLFVLPIFIFDKNKFDNEENELRVNFVYNALEEIQSRLITIGSSLQIYHGNPTEVFDELANKYFIVKVFSNHDFEPYSIYQDNQIREFLMSRGIEFVTFKDHVIFEKNEVTKDDGKPYTVFTPYSKKWKSRLKENNIEMYQSENFMDCFLKMDPKNLTTLDSMGFHKVACSFSSKIPDENKIRMYSDQRDFPALDGTSKLSVHLRFGTISIRQLAIKAVQLNETFLNELIWRDFYHMILWHFPNVGNGKLFKPEFDTIPWRLDENEFKKWCNGETGYPIVDAGMRELNATGFMHNRVRMIAASFLSKHLLLDWRWGESYFASKLLDYDLAANNGGWQWASGSGCDASPYFRIFNPYLQTKKFDPEMKYIKKWVPEFQDENYPKPIVEHEFARKRCLQTYTAELKMKKYDNGVYNNSSIPIFSYFNKR